MYKVYIDHIKPYIYSYVYKFIIYIICRDFYVYKLYLMSPKVRIFLKHRISNTVVLSKRQTQLSL